MPNTPPLPIIASRRSGCRSWKGTQPAAFAAGLFRRPVKPVDRDPGYGRAGYKEIQVALYGDKFLNRGMAVLAIDGPG